MIFSLSVKGIHMFDELFKIQELSNIDTRTLLWGDDNQGYNMNCKIFNLYRTQKDFLDCNTLCTCIFVILLFV